MRAAAIPKTSMAIAAAVALLASRVALAQGWEPSPPSENIPQAIGSDDPAPPASSPDSNPIPLHFEVGAEGAYVMAPIRGGTNPFGVGFGGRAAITIGNFFLGGNVVDFLGGTDVDVSYRSLLAGVEAGYEFRLRIARDTFVILRPQVGIGDAVIYYTDPTLAKVDVVSTASGSRSSSTSDTISVNNVYLDPGATAMLTSGGMYLSVNASALILPGIVYGGADATTWLSYGTRLSLGLRF